MSLTERVARAICKARGIDPSDAWVPCKSLWWEAFVDEAQAAIDAMQEGFAEADRDTREECAEICDQMPLYTALDAADAIRETIRD